MSSKIHILQTDRINIQGEKKPLCLLLFLHQNQDFQSIRGILPDRDTPA